MGIISMYGCKEIAGDELVKALQIKNKIPRRKALSLLEEKVITILSEKGYVSKEETFGTAGTTMDLLEDEEEDEEFVPDGEVDEGDIHIRPTSRKPTPLVSLVLNLLANSWLIICCRIGYNRTCYVICECLPVTILSHGNYRDL